MKKSKYDVYVNFFYRKKAPEISIILAFTDFELLSKKYSVSVRFPNISLISLGLLSRIQRVSILS